MPARFPQETEKDARFARKHSLQITAARAYFQRAKEMRDVAVGDYQIGHGIVGGLAITMTWVFGNLFILRRVRALVEGTERLKAGDLESRVQATGRDELGVLLPALMT